MPNNVELDNGKYLHWADKGKKEPNGAFMAFDLSPVECKVSWPIDPMDSYQIVKIRPICRIKQNDWEYPTAVQSTCAHRRISNDSERENLSTIFREELNHFWLHRSMP